MQLADFLSAVFFYLKVGENLNQNWIVENLNNAFSTWNGKLGELWGLVTTGPQTFKGGAVWSVMQTLHNGMVGMSFKMKRTLEMRRVESAFADYLENEDSIDLLWSDKVGYVFLTINEKTHQSESCEDLHTAPQLCHRLLDDMAITVLLQTKRNHNFTNMDKDEAARVRAAWKPVIEKLPDYAYLCDEILREAQENEEENGIDLQ